MSSYTMQLRSYIESFSQYDSNLSMRDKIEIGRKKLFDFDYPLFDENYRKVFETHIIRKFYMREIGFETEGLFKFQLETWLSINMPYYNKLFESEMLKYDPLVNSEMKVTHNQKIEKSQADTKTTDTDIDTKQRTLGTSKSYGESETNQKNSGTDSVSSKDTTNTDDFERHVKSDTPDGRLALQTEEGKGVIEYASEIEENKINNNSISNKESDKKHDHNKAETIKADSIANTDSSTDGSSKLNSINNLNSNINEVEDFIQHRQGKIGETSYSDLVMKYRNSFIRIENMIHKELQQLFMLVY